jgi:glycosyltransferase involved in cell wall biosynthesis
MHGKKVGLDIMHSYHDFMAHYVSKLVKFPTVYSIHDPPYPENTMEAWRIRQFPEDIYIPISKSHRDSFQNKIKFTDVIYHGVNLGSYTFHVNKKNYLAFMGRYLKEKGIVEAITAARAVQIPLHIAGDKAYHKLVFYTKQIKPLLSKGHIQEIGFMDGEAKNKFLGEARAFLFPIKWEEPFGMVLIETMACGTPVIAFNRGSVPEIVKDQETGYLVDPEAGIDGLVRAVKKLLKLPKEKYSKMVHACRKRVEEKFTVEKMVSGYEKVYRKVISR